MDHYQLVSDYKHTQSYKESFNELAKTVFEIDFSKWYDKGYWNDSYICYSYVDGDKVIANASISKMTIVSQGQEYKAIQVGTVMTHPDYRGQGLSAKLMNHILEKYEDKYDFIYLFANETVLDFYPKFGFDKVQESSFSLNIADLTQLPDQTQTLRRLDINNISDFQIIERAAAERIPTSSLLGIKNNEHLLMFYCILVFNESIYYIEEEDVVVIFQEEDKQLHVFDIISSKSIEIEIIVSRIVTASTETINFYFTPDYKGKNIHTQLITESDDTLFVRPLLQDLPKHMLFPLTSHA